MLTKVTKKEYKDIQVSDLDGNLHYVKVLNFTATGTKTSRLDRQCVISPDSLLNVGTEFLLPDNKVLIISHKQSDIYHGSIIRYTLDCVEASHSIDIVRTELLKNGQGGLSNKQDTDIYTNIPCKIALSDITSSKVVDSTTPKYIMYLSNKYVLKVGDRIVIHDTRFELAKIESLVHITPGLIEVRFDRDPRW